MDSVSAGRFCWEVLSVALSGGRIEDWLCLEGVACRQLVNYFEFGVFRVLCGRARRRFFAAIKGVVDWVSFAGNLCIRLHVANSE